MHSAVRQHANVRVFEIADPFVHSVPAARCLFEQENNIYYIRLLLTHQFGPCFGCTPPTLDDSAERQIWVWVGALAVVSRSRFDTRSIVDGAVERPKEVDPLVNRLCAMS